MKIKVFFPYFLIIFLIGISFTGASYYFIFTKIANIDAILRDISLQSESSSSESLIGYDLKEYYTSFLSEEEKQEIERVIGDTDWENLSAQEIDNKLQSHNIPKIGDPEDLWYSLSPQSLSGVILDSQWDTLSFSEIDKKLKIAGLPPLGNPEDPFYYLTPDEIKERYGETGNITYIGTKQKQSIERLFNIQTYFFLFGSITFSFITALVGGYYFLWKSQEPLRKAIQKQKEFISNASHEMRTPLALIKSEAEVLLRDQKSSLSDYKNFAKNAIEDTQRLSSLTSRLLSVSGLETAQKLQKQEIHIISFFSFLKEKFSPLLETRELKISVESPKNLHIFTQKEYLEQICTIALDNAIKYSLPHSKNIYLIASKSSTKTYITIRDEGVGIPPQQIEKVFERFYRISQNESSEGFGIGLALAKELAESLGASIHLESTLGVGTSFILEFENES